MNTKATMSEAEAKSAKGQQQIRSILRAASNVLVQGGMEKFSVNRVAAKAGISLGNLQYYFPKRRDLIGALLNLPKIELTTSMQELIDNAEIRNNSGEAALMVFLDTVLRLNASAKECAVAWNAWSMSLYNPATKQLLDEWYESYLAIMRDTIKNCNPDISDKRLEFISLFVVSALEGESVLWRSAMSDQKQHDRYIDSFKKAVLELVYDRDNSN
jgi:AcrR family transcriptional regulator